MFDNVPTSDITLPLTPIDEEKSEEQLANEAAQEAEVRDVAAFPGWSRIKAQMLKDAEDLRTHRSTQIPLMYDNSTTDEEIGRLVRNQLLMATWIEQYIERIDSAVMAVAGEENKSAAELKP